MKVYSKVILSGEHAVLRGGLAVVAPFKEYGLAYKSEFSDRFSLELLDSVKPYEILIQGTLERALASLDKNLDDLKLRVSLESLVPLGKGLGGSAALCVFVSKLLIESALIKEEDLFNFSKELENMFHGESSGVDIAGCVSSSTQTYMRGLSPKPFKVAKAPFLYLSSTDEVGSTEECIEKVLSLKTQNSTKFNDLDEQMDQASRLVYEGLGLGEEKLFNKGLNLGAKTFKSWGLYTEKMCALEASLLEKGSLGVKPTGSGMGGFMLSSWSKKQKLEDLPPGSLELLL